MLRANFATNGIDTFTNPIQIDFGTEPLLMCIDQNSSTGITIGDRAGNVREFIALVRDRNESVENYLITVEHFIRALTSKMNLYVYSLEDAVGYGNNGKFNRFNSQKVTFNIFGKYKEIYQKVTCIDANGNEVYASSNSKLEIINNNSWKAEIVPKQYRQHYKDDKVAVHKFASNIFYILESMPQDVSDAFCMYLFLLKTKYGTSNLKGTKSSVDNSHSLTMLAFPWSGIDPSNKDYMEYSDGSGKPTEAQELFYKFYKEHAIRSFLSTLQNKEHMDDFIRHDYDKLQGMLANSIIYKSPFMMDEYLEHAALFDVSEEKEIIQFEYNKRLTLEENFRCFTGRDKNIYYTIINRGNEYCSIIAQFQLHLEGSQKILVVGTAIN